jgi:hypothetical protein
LSKEKEVAAVHVSGLAWPSARVPYIRHIYSTCCHFMYMASPLGFITLRRTEIDFFKIKASEALLTVMAINYPSQE